MEHKFWKWVTNEAPDSFGSNRTLYLGGQISDETWWGDEVTPKAFKAEVTLTNEEVKMLRHVGKGYKVTGYDYKGQLKLHKVSSYMQEDERQHQGG